MNCDEARQLLHGYLDDELDLATALQIEKHLAGCADCQKQLDAAQAIARAVAQPAVYQPAPDALREKLKLAIRAEMKSAEATAAPSVAPVAAPQAPSRMLITPWYRRPSLLSGIAAALILGIGSTILLLPQQNQNVQFAELVDSHLRSLESNHLFDVESTDQHTVKPWFAGKLDFSPPVIDLSGEGFPLVGGRLDYLDQKKVAALIYKRNKHVINLFIAPGDVAPQTDSHQGYNVVRFEARGMSCWAISDLNAGELQQFAELFTAQKAASTRS